MTELYWRMVYIKLSTNGYAVLTRRGNEKLKFKGTFLPVNAVHRPATEISLWL